MADNRAGLYDLLGANIMILIQQILKVMSVPCY